MPQMPGQPGAGSPPSGAPPPAATPPPAGTPAPGTAPPPAPGGGAWQGAGGSGQAPGSAPAAPAPPPAPAGGTGPAPGFGPSGTAPQAPYSTPAWGATATAQPKSGLRPLAIIGAIGIIAGGILPWIDFNFDLTGFKIPAKFLFTGNGQIGEGFSVGILLVVFGAIALLLSFTPQFHVIRRIFGLLGLAVPVAFVIQVLVGGTSVGDLFGDLGPGAYVAFVGGILALVG